MNRSFGNLKSPMLSPIEMDRRLNSLNEPSFLQAVNESFRQTVNESLQTPMLQNLPEHKFYEDNMNYFVFLIMVIVGAFLGILSGSFIDNLTSKIQGSKSGRGYALAFLTLQLVFIVTVLFIAIKFKWKPSFDSWLMETLAGYTFGILFLAGQPTLAQNATEFLKF
jgi:hypothetical protein